MGNKHQSIIDARTSARAAKRCAQVLVSRSISALRMSDRRSQKIANLGGRRARTCHGAVQFARETYSGWRPDQRLLCFLPWIILRVEISYAPRAGAVQLDHRVLVGGGKVRHAWGKGDETACS
jgi:hypothetical protein